MKLGLVAGYSPAEMSVPMDVILEAENLGFDSVWTSEAWGSDAVTPAAWILARTSRINVGTAIIQMGARAPACAAMTAMTLDAMSGGRFILGVGPSGPQVIEGWYGVPYGRPLTRTREYISIIRKILARKEPLTHEGEHYQIPYRGEGASGLGKPLRSILHGNPGLRIFTGAFTENGLRTSAEVADGVFPVWMNPERFDLFEDALHEGFERGRERQEPRDVRDRSLRRGGGGRRPRTRAPGGSASTSPSTSAAMGRGTRTSTTTTPSGSDTRRRRSRSRTTSSPDAGRRRPPRCPTSSSTTWPSSVRRTGSATG